MKEPTVTETLDLIVGGTGMLAGVTTSLLGENRNVTVLSRGKLPICSLQAGGKTPRAIKLDYNDQSRLEETLSSAVNELGSFGRSICWVHSENAERVCMTVANHTRDLFVHVMGSSAKDPSHPDMIGSWQERFRQAHPRLVYRIVVLGFMRGPTGSSRWLQHKEICQGVLASLENTDAVQVVGTTIPWSARP